MCLSRLQRVVDQGVGLQVTVEDAQGARHLASLLAFEGEAPRVGEWLVVHSGFALQRVDPAEAEAIVAELRQAAELGQLE